MIKKISHILYRLIKFTDKIFRVLFKRSFLKFFKEFLENDSYKSIIIQNQKINFFVPNELTEWRVNTFFNKEPETLEWIDSFNNNKKFVLWDIGSNIGLYSIYTALKHNNCEIISFEPSTSNLRTLSRNISINNLENKVKIFTNPLTNRSNEFLTMKESGFSEGGSINSYGVKYDNEGKDFKSLMNYQLCGKSINSILEDKILEAPNYIKMDVDGIEHLILEQADKCLTHNSLISLSIEINEIFEKQYKMVLKIMNDYNFKILHKKHNNKMFNEESKYSKTFNYIFVRK
ncbi:FkbM family methyltransferase [Candidatus Pelagibacter sp.]|nr:FkbM family methyltransferase [Candidatus Pelagibacter sp.]